MYVLSKGSTSMFDYTNQMPYTIMINFLCNNSYIPYYLLVCVLIWSYWPFIIPFFEYLFSFLRFKSLFNSWIWKYYYKPLFHCYYQLSSPRECFFLPEKWCHIPVAIVYCWFLLFLCVFLHGWVRPLILIADLIGSIFLSHHIIVIL